MHLGPSQAALALGALLVGHGLGRLAVAEHPRLGGVPKNQAHGRRGGGEVRVDRGLKIESCEFELSKKYSILEKLVFFRNCQKLFFGKEKLKRPPARRPYVPCGQPAPPPWSVAGSIQGA